VAIERGQLDPRAETPLGPHSIVRTIAAEPATLFLVQRTLVMDVAHPIVAAGVEDHSQFRSKPLRRVLSTLDAALRLVFGDSDVARGAARQIYRTHDRIEGRVESAPVSGAPSSKCSGGGEGLACYSAHDASLLTWVWATLVDSAELAYTRWVRALSARESHEHYAEMTALARFLGIPSHLVPPDRAAFHAYMDAMLDGEVLWSSPLSRAVAYQILWYRHRAVPPPVVRAGRVLAFVTFDPRLTRGLGLALDPADERFGRHLDAALTRHYRHLPRAGERSALAYVRLRRRLLG
jgi:uncharacterized protein (DUF2236 family)